MFSAATSRSHLVDETRTAWLPWSSHGMTICGFGNAVALVAALELAA
ncbi:hypothetical protein [Roseibium algae]|uniref:Uncharacterized protein n=1 Tax=Roseibium algae TaxID=3123038 RepID=A0ABU8TKQ8_9HYPH